MTVKPRENRVYNSDCTNTRKYVADGHSESLIQYSYNLYYV